MLNVPESAGWTAFGILTVNYKAKLNNSTAVNAVGTATQAALLYHFNCALKNHFNPAAAL